MTGSRRCRWGPGPYKFVSFTPGVELVLEANEQYWRKVPSVKRLVFKSVPDEATRLAMLKRGEADIAYSIRGALAEDLQRTPGLTLKPNYPPGTFWLVFAEQWDPKSPWADRRVRLAANLAIDRQAINQAETLGFSKITGSIIPHTFEGFWPPPAPSYDPQKAKQLLTEAGYPNGLDAGDYYCDASYANLGRGRGQLPEGGGHPGSAPPARARGVHRAEQPEEAEEHHPDGQRRVRERGHAARRLRGRRAAPSPTGATPTSKACSASRRASGTPRSGKRSCTGSSR